MVRYPRGSPDAIETPRSPSFPDATPKGPEVFYESILEGVPEQHREFFRKHVIELESHSDGIKIVNLLHSDEIKAFKQENPGVIPTGRQLMEKVIDVADARDIRLYLDDNADMVIYLPIDGQEGDLAVEIPWRVFNYAKATVESYSYYGKYDFTLLDPPNLPTLAFKEAETFLNDVDTLQRTRLVSPLRNARQVRTLDLSPSQEEEPHA